MPDLLRVFLSSTYEDLVNHRAAVLSLLRGTGTYEPIAMEDFMARSDEASVACLKDVGRSDLFVGIYAWRYGHIPAGSAVSITEMELLEAEELEIPCFCFFIDKNYPWPKEHREKEGTEPLRALESRVGSKHVVKRFTSPDNLAGLVLASLQRHEAEAAPNLERHHLLLLLDSVKKWWLVDVLEKRVPRSRRIALELDEWPGAFENSAAWESEISPSLHSGNEILRLFKQGARKLLITGGPGSGKTTILLLLFQSLARMARRQPLEPIPVVLNLASWAKDRLPLGKWMAKEIGRLHKKDADVVFQWLVGDKICPLLDGLDEVGAKWRGECAEEIKVWLEKHGLHGIAVTCSTSAWKDLPLPRLDLSMALAVRSLSLQKVEEYVAAAPAADVLRRVLARNERLRELTQAPQLLSILGEICEQDGEALTMNPQELTEKRLYDRYIGLRLEKMPKRYPRERTLGALIWLASRMKEHGLTIFSLEGLQPSWLTEHDRRSYVAAARILAGALLTLPVAVWMQSWQVLVLGIAAGDMARHVEGSTWCHKLPRQARAIGFIIAVALLSACGGVIAGGRVDNVLRATGLLTPLFALVFGPRIARRDGSLDDISVAEALPWSGWSWSWASAWTAVLLGPALGAAMFVINKIGSQPPLGTELFIVAGVFAGLAFAAGGLLGGLRRSLKPGKIRPNEGIWLTLRNAGVVALPVALTVSLLAAPLAYQAGKIGPEHAMLWGIILGFWVALAFGGLDVLYHFVLRALLRLRGYAPADYVGFLNYAAASGLLLKSGGSYQFFYGQSMLEHLALPPPVAPHPSAPSPLSFRVA